MRFRDNEVVETMIQYGGSFVKAMAHAYQLADYDNKRRLQLAFPEYWKEYDEMTLHIEQSKGNVGKQP